MVATVKSRLITLLNARAVLLGFHFGFAAAADEAQAVLVRLDNQAAFSSSLHPERRGSGCSG